MENKIELWLVIGILVLVEMTANGAWADNGAYRVRLAVGRSQSLSAENTRQIVLGDSTIAKAQLANATGKLVVTGLQPGITNLDITRKDGKRIRYLLRVLQHDPEIVRGDLAEAFVAYPELQLRTIGEKVLVEGTARSPAVYATVQQVLRGYPEVINVVQEPQATMEPMVVLEAILVEVSGARARELGISWPDGLGVEGRWTGAIDVPSPNGVIGTITLASTLAASIKMLSQSGAARLRANPTLVARHGTQSTFRVGGELPVAAVNQLGQTTVAWKNYGVELRFTPRVDGNRHVSLHLVAEVSQLDYSNAVETGEGTIPALKSRFTEGQVDLNEGEALVVAELFNELAGKTVQQVPFLGAIPLLGEMFRTRRMQNDSSRTYLVVIPKVLEANGKNENTKSDEEVRRIYDAADSDVSAGVMEMFP